MTPWLWLRCYDGSDLVVTEHNDMVAEVFGEDSAATAKLIASTPDLAEACQWALCEIERVSDGNCGETLKKLRAAMTKAGIEELK